MTGGITLNLHHLGLQIASLAKLCATIVCAVVVMSCVFVAQPGDIDDSARVFLNCEGVLPDIQVVKANPPANSGFSLA